MPEPQADDPTDSEESAIEETATPAAETAAADDPTAPLDYRALPAYEGSPYVYVNDGEPSFTEAERAAEPGTERYDELDRLGRCTDTFAVVGPETQPTEKRGSIGSVKPTGWHISKYDFVDGKYLFNRCHLLGYQLTGENANERNLITGTRYLNVDGMLPFENAVDDYVDATGNHVLMRATPLFHEDELVARGVHMQAESIEDDGDGISFNVYCYNVQPGVVIDYATGENMLAEDATPLPDVSGTKDTGNAAKVDEGSTSAKGTAGADDAASKGQLLVGEADGRKEPQGREGHPREPPQPRLRPLQTLQPVKSPTPPERKTPANSGGGLLIAGRAARIRTENQGIMSPLLHR